MIYEFLQIGVIIFGSLFLWQYLALRLETLNKYNLYRPSLLLNSIACILQDIFYGIGKWIAYISSFYEYLGFRDMIKALQELFKPCIEIILSVFHLFKGYLETALTYDYTYSIIFGTITLLLVISLIIYRFYF